MRGVSGAKAGGVRGLCLLGLLGLGLWPDSGFAQVRGVVARLRSDVPLEAPIVLRLVGAKGTYDIPLADDGRRPDVTANDGVFGGAMAVGELSFDVNLLVAGRLYTGGEVRFEAGERAGDLELTFENGKLIAGALAASHVGVHFPAPPPDERMPPADGGLAGAMADPNEPESLGAPSPDGGTLTGRVDKGEVLGSSEPTTLFGWVADQTWFALGLVLGLSGLLLGWRRTGRAQGLPGGAPLPGPGLFGPGSPATGAGLLVCGCPEEDRNALAWAISATVARSHRLLRVGGAQLPPVAGGPVWQAVSEQPDSVARQLANLAENPGNPLALLVVLGTPDGDPGRWARLLREGETGVLITDEASAHGGILCRREGQGFRVRIGAMERQIPVDAQGFVSAPPSL
jgi:hypothetical protein